MRIVGGRNFGDWIVVIVALCAAIVCAGTEWVRIAENEQQAGIAQLHKRAASQQVHIVEIDAQSLAQVRRWPWPREHYARLVRELDSAGARSIVFDIDFSSRSTPESDAEFARAIAASKTPVVMPTFAQSASETADRRLDALPVPELRENASLASASVVPDADARVRRMLYGSVTDGTPRPSMSAQIAGADGAVDSYFAIDFAIDPETIPRHSFISVERGNFDRKSVEGKDVIVGATAIELGDRYGVPSYGVIPGVTIQALAAETLIAGGLREMGWVPIVALCCLLAFSMAFSATYAATTMRFGLSVALVFTLEAAFYHFGMTVLKVVPGVILLTVVAVGQGLRLARHQLREKSLVDAETGMPNAPAFATRDVVEGQFVAAAFVRDFDSIQAVLGKAEVGKFIERLVDRMSSSHSLGEVFRADTRIIAWNHAGGSQQLIDTFETMLGGLKRPLEVGGKRIDVMVSFGIAPAGELAAASRAASQAAREGKLWHAHEDAEAAIIAQRVSLMGELDEAIEAGNLKVVYQPKLRLSTDRIDSVEALVRWEHPERGMLSPDLFIPLAEETNRIEPLTLLVLQKAIDDLASWCREGIVISAAVNISAALISSEAFVGAVESILRDTGIPRERLIFEVTESATMRDPDRSIRNLERFRAAGIGISMDDYGTGQSTLSYLQKLPLAELKIDRAFVQNAHRDRSDALLVRSTIQLAHSLGLRVVCEGVEEAECLDFLRQAKCDYAQGYFISKPARADDIASILKSVARERPAKVDA